MDEFGKLFEESLRFQELRKGQTVKGRVVKVDERNIYVDIGYKVEAIMSKEELPSAKEGDEVKGVVERFSYGQPVISYRRYVEGKLSSFLQNAYERGRPITGTVVSKEGDGYVVDISGVKAFLPLKEAGKNLKEGKKIIAKIKEFSKNSAGLHIVLSQMEIIKRQEEKKKARLLAKLKVGDAVEGRVIKIDPEKGITLLVGGVLRAFVPLEELSWGRDKNPYHYAEIDERLRVKVKRIPKDGQFIFASLREMKENPWEKVKDSLKKGQVVSGRVVEVGEKGLVVEITEGVEGFVPKEEISYEGEVTYKKGDRVSAQVLDVEPSKRKLILSIKRTLPKPWELYLQEHPAGSKVEGLVEKIEGAKAYVRLAPNVMGVIHRSDLSWTRPGKVEEYLQVGQSYQFAVLGLEGKLVKLGLKQLTENPWEKVLSKYKVGDTVRLKVKAVHPFGVFLELPEGIDGLLPISEMPKGVRLEEGQEVEVKLIDLSEGKATFSMKGEEKAEEEIVKPESADRGFTLGDILRKKIKL